MSFSETPLRRLCLIRAIGFCAIAIAVAGLPLIVEVDSAGTGFALALAGWFLLISAINLRNFRRTAAGDVVRPPVGFGAMPDEARSLRRWLWLTALSFPGLTALIVSNLNRLESGEVEQVLVWEPVATVYEFLGYWPAVLVTPATGIACCLVFLKLLRAQGRSETAESTTTVQEPAA